VAIFYQFRKKENIKYNEEKEHQHFAHLLIAGSLNYMKNGEEAPNACKLERIVDNCMQPVTKLTLK
jgi:hypothetical protein